MTVMSKQVTFFLLQGELSFDVVSITILNYIARFRSRYSNCTTLQ